MTHTRELGRTEGSRVIAWTLGAIVVAAVAFGLYLWGRPQTFPAKPVPPPPSGPGARAPIPSGSPSGWRLAFSDDFNGQALNRNVWRVYTGRPGGDPAGLFEPSHIAVSGGMLVISGFRDKAFRDQWVTGGVSTALGFVQTYGKYLIRFRMDAGIGISHAVLLFPADDSWPPEVDISEDNGGGRDNTLATLHYGSQNSKISRLRSVDLTRWHTLGVEWTPALLRFTLDGQIWSTIASKGVPHVPMVLAIQTQTWPCTSRWGRCPDSTTPHNVRLYVDWVVAYRQAPR